MASLVQVSMQQRLSLHCVIARALTIYRSSTTLPEQANTIRLQLNQNPTSHLWDDYHAVAQTMLDDKYYNDAEECFRFSLRKYEDNPTIRERLSATLREAGRLQEAANELHSVIQCIPDRDIKGLLYLDLGHLLERMIPLFNSGPDWDVERTPSIFSVGLQKERISALDCYRRAVALHPRNGEVRKRLADALAILDCREEALDEFQRAATLSPNDICCATHVQYTAEPRSMPVLPMGPRPDGNESLMLHNLVANVEGKGSADEIARAFERDGVVIFPSFLSYTECLSLEKQVEDSLRLEVFHDKPLNDFTSETREASGRAHCSLPVERATVLNEVCARLWPILSKLLQANTIPLIGSGFMRIEPGANAQELHKDVHHFDRHNAVDNLPQSGGPRTVSIQLQLTDTSHEKLPRGTNMIGTGASSKGSLEVLPGSHRPDAAAGRPETIRKALETNVGVVPLCVPSGTVTLYSSRLWHRGGSNNSNETRTFYFLTVTEPDAPAPPGLIHTMEMEDVGKWVLTREGTKNL